MRNLFPILLLALSLFLGNSLNAQNNLEKVSALLNSGDINSLSEQFDEKIEVSVLEDDSYTKAEAENMLNNFFSDKSVSEYVAIHKGNSGENAYYQIGELRSGQESYRTYFYTKFIDGNYLVQEFRIERM